MREAVPRASSSVPRNLVSRLPTQYAEQRAIAASIAARAGPPACGGVFQLQDRVPRRRTPGSRRGGCQDAPTGSGGGVADCLLARRPVDGGGGTTAASACTCAEPESEGPRRASACPCSRRRVARRRGSATASAAVDLEVVLLDEAVDVVAIDAGLGRGARDVAVVAGEQRGQVVALECSRRAAPWPP